MVSFVLLVVTVDWLGCKAKCQIFLSKTDNVLSDKKLAFDLWRQKKWRLACICTNSVILEQQFSASEHIPEWNKGLFYWNSASKVYFSSFSKLIIHIISQTEPCYFDRQEMSGILPRNTINKSYNEWEKWHTAKYSTWIPCQYRLMWRVIFACNVVSHKKVLSLFQAFSLLPLFWDQSQNRANFQTVHMLSFFHYAFPCKNFHPQFVPESIISCSTWSWLKMEWKWN